MSHCPTPELPTLTTLMIFATPLNIERDHPEPALAAVGGDTTAAVIHCAPSPVAPVCKLLPLSYESE